MLKAFFKKHQRAMSIVIAIISLILIALWFVHLVFGLEYKPFFAFSILGLILIGTTILTILAVLKIHPWVLPVGWYMVLLTWVWNGFKIHWGY